MQTVLPGPVKAWRFSVAIFRILSTPTRRWRFVLLAFLAGPLAFLPIASFAQGTLIKDIHPGPGSADIRFPVTVGNQLYFSANDSIHGTELWKSDATTAGTIMVADIVAGSGSSNPSNLMNVNGTLYFTVGQALWKSNGTSLGTQFVANLSGTDFLTLVNHTAYYILHNATSQTQLWKTNLQTGQSTLVKSFSWESGVFEITGMASLNNQLYLIDYSEPDDPDAVNQAQFWKSDGSAAGTQLIKSWPDGQVYRTQINFLTVYQGNLYFALGDEFFDFMKSDGTPDGTVYFSRAPGYRASGIQVAGDKLILFGLDEYVNFTVKGYDQKTNTQWYILAGSSSLGIREVVAVGDTLFSKVYDYDARVDQVWKNWGPGKDAFVLDSPTGLTLLAGLPNALFFTKPNEALGDELWKLGINPPTCTATGSILREYWANVPGNTIASIPLNTPPTSTSQLTSLRTTSNIADHYGQRIRGYICAPVTGNYTFFIQGDDAAELYLSSDKNPANRQRIASAQLAWSWTQRAAQRSAPIPLIAGQSYYVEVLHKEGSGGDQVRVGWRTPEMAASAEPLIIPGSVLSPFVVPASTRESLPEQPLAEARTDELTVSPNPFAERAMITFTTAVTEMARLQVYDLQGHLVGLLFEGVSQSGEAHQLAFEGRHLSQGMYLVRLSTDRKVNHQKLLLTR